MPTSVSLLVWLPEERAKWVEMRAKRDPRDPRHVRAMSADLEKTQARRSANPRSPTGLRHSNQEHGC
jgi:hypothetical protein